MLVRVGELVRVERVGVNGRVGTSGVSWSILTSMTYDLGNGVKGKFNDLSSRK